MNSKFKKARETAGLKQVHVVAVIKTIEPKFAAPKLSDIENDVVYPTPKQLDKLGELYNVPPVALISQDDVRYWAGLGKCMPRKQRPENRKYGYRLQCRVDAKTDIAFRQLAEQHGRDVNGMLAYLITRALKRGNKNAKK